EKLQAEMTKQSEEVSIKEELERVKEAVIRQAEEVLELTIADVPRKALEAVRRQGVSAAIAKVAAGEWGTRWSEAVDAEAQKRAVARTTGAREKLLVAFHGFLGSVHRSHEEIVKAFKDFFKFIEQSFKSMVQAVSERISSVSAVAAPEGQEAWESLQRKVNDSAVAVEESLKGVRERIDQALDDAHKKVQSVQDLSATQDVLGIIATFQESVTAAAAEAMKAVKAQVKGIEQEFEQREFDQLLKAEYNAAATRLAQQRALEKAEAELRAAAARLEAARERAAEQKKFDESLEKEYHASAERLAEQRKAEATSARADVMAVAGEIQVAFNTFLGGALKKLTDHATEIYERIDNMVKSDPSYKASLEAERKAGAVYDGSVDNVVDSVFRHINGIADHRVKSATSGVQSHVDFLKGIRELESVRNMLRSFQGSTVKVMGDVLKQISEGRAAIVDRVAELQDQARNVQGLDVSPQKALESALNGFQEELIAAQKDTAALEAKLDQVRAAVKIADDEMSETIRSMPYKALAAVPYIGVGQMLEDALKNVGSPDWKVPEGMDQELAAALQAWADGGKLPEDAKQRLANALKSFQAHVRESNGQVVTAFKGLFMAIVSAFQDAASRVVMTLLVKLNEVAALAAVQTVVQEKAEEAEEAEEVGVEAEQELDQVDQEVDEASAGAEDLDVVGQVLTGYQESVTVAAEEVLDLETVGQVEAAIPGGSELNALESDAAELQVSVAEEEEREVQAVAGVLAVAKAFPVQQQASGASDALFEEAQKLLEAAGWKKKNGAKPGDKKQEELDAKLREIKKQLISLVGVALREVKGQIERAIEAADKEVQSQDVQDLSATRDILGIVKNFQDSVVTAAGKAMETVEAQVKNIEQEIAQQKTEGAVEGVTVQQEVDGVAPGGSEPDAWVSGAKLQQAEHESKEQLATATVEVAEPAVQAVSGVLEDITVEQAQVAAPGSELDTVVVVAQVQQGAVWGLLP
ncbi:MAG: hypothetical protein ACTJLL_03845, partial [Anaplasma sp.]